MASPPKILKTAAGTPIQVIRPAAYEYTDSIQVSSLFPNVFERPLLTCEEKMDVLRAIPRPFKAVTLNATHGNLSAPRLDFYVNSGDMKLLPERDGLKETDRIRIFFGAYHYDIIDENLATMSMWLVDQAGRRIFTPELVTSKEPYGVNRKEARVVDWFVPLASLWDNKDKFLPDGIIRLKYQVGQIFIQEHVALPQSFNTLSNNMLDLLKSGEKSDFTIKCGSSEFKVHEMILASRSPVFKAMFSHQMFSETNSREMTIPDVEPDVFEILLQFVYSSFVDPEQLEFKKLGDLISAADKYQLTELKDICFSYITNDKKMNLENIGDISLLAFHHPPSKEIMNKVKAFVDANFKALRQMAEFKEVMKKCMDMFWDEAK